MRKLPPRLAGRDLFLLSWLVCYRPLASSIDARLGKIAVLVHRCRLRNATPTSDHSSDRQLAYRCQARRK